MRLALPLLALLANLPGCYLAHQTGEAGAGVDAGPRGDTGVRPPGITAAVAAGFLHVCSLDPAGNVYCWGEGRRPRRNPTPIPAGIDGPAVAIAAGYGRNCAILQTGEAHCWGEWFPGPVPSARTAYTQSDVGFTVCLVTVDGGLLCDPRDRPGPVPFVVTERVESGTQAVSAGEHFMCALVEGTVRCFGENHQGELGRAPGTTEDELYEVEGLPQIVDIACGRQHACALTIESEVYCWGHNVRSQLGAPGPSTHTPLLVRGLPSNLVDLEAGHNNTCALRANGELVCWGDNDFGQLGRPDRGLALGATEIDLPARVVGMSVGGSFICAIDDAANLWCWGRNDFGQLGDGTLDQYRGQPALVRF